MLKAWMRRLVLSFVCVTAIPAAVLAQDTSIAGVVRDDSGAVLPGVTVEASSPALIEKSRTAVTDGAGQYKIISLVPGTYAVTFSLTGFSSVRREGIILQAEVTLPVNAELKVGALQETITVTGVSPVVDTQNTATRTVMTRDVMDAIPTGRNLQAVGIMIPGTGLQVGGGGAISRDVGGSGGLQQSPLSYRGSTASVTSVEGMRMNNLCGSGQYSHYWNDGAFQEVSYSTGSDSAEMGQGGLRINMIPKDGGNTFRGNIFGNWTGGEGWNSNNLDAELRNRGITNVSEVHRIYDINPSLGGPIRKDKLWFQTTLRWQGVDKTVVDSFYDADPDPVKYVADLNRPGVDDGRITSTMVRLTWQATRKNKVTGYVDKQTKYRGHWGISASNPPEASAQQHIPYDYTSNLKWTATLSNRLLFEAGYGIFTQRYNETYQPEVTPTTYRILDQITNKSCCAYSINAFHWSRLSTYSSKLSFVTGSHNFSGGFTLSEGPRRTEEHHTGDLTMRFGQTSVNANASGFGPNRVTLILPVDASEGIFADSAFWVNDKFTYKRATITAGLRFDWFIGEVLQSKILPSVWLPAQTFEGFKDVPNWKDMSPRLGFAYDLFGTGKTAIKVSAARYVDAQTVGFAASTSPTNLVDADVDLTWTDNNGDFTIFNPDGSVQDRDFNPNTTANELAPLANSTFGQVVQSTRIDPRIRDGYGRRGYSWDFSGGIQHELVPRVSVGFTYYRRYTNRNLVVTDNVNLGPEDYTGPYCATVPVDSRLPDGGGWQTCGIYQRTRASFDEPVDNLQTFASTLLEGSGQRPIRYNHGYEVTLNARLGANTIMQGGVNADRAINDTCYAAVYGSPQVVQVNPMTGERYCHDVTPFRPDFKMLVAHTFPRDIQLSGTYQLTQGPGILAAWTLNQAGANQNGWTIATANGSTAAQVAAATTTLNLIQTGQMYAPGLNQLDIRAAKRIRMGARRLQLMFDVYNVTNDNWVFTENGTLGTNYTVASTWRRPTNVLAARMLKIGAQFDF